jgi:hypothetical protein
MNSGHAANIVAPPPLTPSCHSIDGIEDAQRGVTVLLCQPGTILPLEGVRHGRGPFLSHWPQRGTSVERGQLVQSLT